MSNLKFTRGKFEGECMKDVAVAFPKYIVFCYEKGTDHMGIPAQLYVSCKGRESPVGFETLPVVRRLQARATAGEQAKIQGFGNTSQMRAAKAMLQKEWGGPLVKVAQYHDETVYAVMEQVPSFLDEIVLGESDALFG